jgi:hypothetical protein
LPWRAARGSFRRYPRVTSKAPAGEQLSRPVVERITHASPNSANLPGALLTPPYEIAAMMGHKDGGKLAMDRYIHVTERDAERRWLRRSVATSGICGRFRKREGSMRLPPRTVDATWTSPAHSPEGPPVR